MSSKTPVSILHEYCILRKEIPKFDLLGEEKTSKLETIFTFEITLFDEYATGSGTSKKAAKHETARALLQLLADKDSKLKSFLKENGLDDNTPIETPYVNHQSENYVGKLDALTLLNNFPSPSYNQIYEEGMSHDKIFTWTCKVGNFTVEASHRTKQQAKHTSAMLMIEALERTFKDQFINTIPEDFRMDYNLRVLDELSFERSRVRAYLLGRRTLMSHGMKISPVCLSKLHRVITEPYLEVVSTVQKVLENMEMSADQFNSFLDGEDSDTIDQSISNFLKEFSDSTAIEIDFVPLQIDVCKNIDNATYQTAENNASCTSSHVNCPSQNDRIVTCVSPIDSNNSDNSLCDQLHEHNKNVSSPTEENNDNTSNTQSMSPLVIVMCKVYIIPTMHFMGISPSFEESKRKASILFLKHIISLKSSNSRKNYFLENFSSGDEAETS